MKFGIFYEHQLPKPWSEGLEEKLFQDALDQVELADKLGTFRRLLRSPKQRLQEQYLRLDSSLIELKAKFDTLFAKKVSLFEVLKEKLNVINPEQILSRGYSLTFTNDGKIASDAKLLKKDDVLETRLAKGKVKSKVIS